MEMPICPKCQNTLFRLQAITPVGQQGNVKIQVLSCSQCNTIIGTTGEIAVLDMIAQTRNNASQVCKQCRRFETECGKFKYSCSTFIIN
jgi:uncharacterized protein with PIN domain